MDVDRSTARAIRPPEETRKLRLADKSLRVGDGRKHFVVPTERLLKLVEADLNRPEACCVRERKTQSPDTLRTNLGDARQRAAPFFIEATLPHHTHSRHLTGAPAGQGRALLGREAAALGGLR
jgi:hypothetical protein